MLPKVQSQSTNQLVYEELKKAIIGGVLQPGASLVERDLAVEMGVSRTPVHEAINRLEAEHLVLRQPNKRVTVAEISLEDLIQLYTIRTDLEVLAVQWAMPHVTPQLLESMKKNLARMIHYGKAEDVERVVQLNIEFHKLILESTHSWYLSMFMEKIHDTVRLFRGRSVSKPGRIETVIRDHENILAAFQARDVAAAIVHIKTHVQGALEALVSQYRSTDDTTDA